MDLNLCVVLFVLQIIGYIFCFRKNIKWMWLCQLGFQMLCTAYPVAMCFYYNSYDSSGWEGLGDAAGLMFSMMVVFVFGLCLIVTIVTIAAKWNKMLKERILC